MVEGKIILSCGHEDPHHPLGWQVSTKDYDGEGNRSVSHLSACSLCFSRWLRKDREILISEPSQYQEWMNNG